MFKKKGVWGWSQQLAELFASSCVHRPLLDSADQEPIIAAPRQEWSVPGDSSALQEGHCFLQHVLKLAVVLHRPYAWVLHQPGQPQRIIKGIASVFQYYLFVVFIFFVDFFFSIYALHMEQMPIMQCSYTGAKLFLERSAKCTLPVLNFLHLWYSYLWGELSRTGSWIWIFNF